MLLVAEHVSELKAALEASPRQRCGPIDAHVAELSLALFLVLHYYGLSGLPEEFKETFGKYFKRLYEISGVYSGEFRKALSQSFERECEMEEKDLRMTALMFFHRDGEADGVDLNRPRMDVLHHILSTMGLSEANCQKLPWQFEGLTEGWLEAISEASKGAEDRAKSEGAKARRSSRPEPPQTPPMPRTTLREALQGLRFNAEPFERVFVAPNIPLKKLNGALNSYGDGLHAKEVVALIDSTLFGGAAEGVLITESLIRAKAPFESFDTRLWKDVSEIVAEGKYVYIEGRRFAELSMPDERDLRQLFGAVNRYLQDIN